MPTPDPQSFNISSITFLPICIGIIVIWLSTIIALLTTQGIVVGIGGLIGNISTETTWVLLASGF
jgi:hypothetical protein